jgi:hypothetical protein
MSRAFIREGDDQWLHDVQPTVTALLIYLTKENNGIRVVEERGYIDAHGWEVHVMSNGLSYCKDNQNRWKVVNE